MSRNGSAIMYHTQGCCKATCKAPHCVLGELPAAPASEHFKASDHQASESSYPTVNTLLLHHYSRQHNRAKHPRHGCTSGCHFCLTLAFPAAYTVPQLALSQTRCCCQYSVRKICNLKRKHRCSLSPFSAWPTTFHISLRHNSMSRPKFQHKENRSRLFEGQFPIMLGTKRAVCAEVFRPLSQSMYKNTTYNTVSHSQIPLLMFLLLENLPIYLPYPYIIAY